jgi:hypothetical protein
VALGVGQQADRRPRGQARRRLDDLGTEPFRFDQCGGDVRHLDVERDVLPLEATGAADRRAADAGLRCAAAHGEQLRLEVGLVVDELHEFGVEAFDGVDSPGEIPGVDHVVGGQLAEVLLAREIAE